MLNKLILITLSDRTCPHDHGLARRSGFRFMVSGRLHFHPRRHHHHRHYHHSLLGPGTAVCGQSAHCPRLHNNDNTERAGTPPQKEVVSFSGAYLRPYSFCPSHTPAHYHQQHTTPMGMLLAARLTDFQESDLHSVRERGREIDNQQQAPQADGFGPVPEPAVAQCCCPSPLSPAPSYWNRCRVKRLHGCLN